MLKIGITTTIPIEVIYAAGMIPVDLNNLFITSQNLFKLTQIAEEAGFPRNICGWIKGIYGATITNPDVETIVVVTEGDCSNTHALAETIQWMGRKIIFFSYPADKDRVILEYQIHKLMSYFGVTETRVKQMKKRLDKIRRLAWEVDRLTWEGPISGKDNHYFMVNCSDMKGNPDMYERELHQFLRNRPQNNNAKGKTRIGFIGIPPLFLDFFEYVESLGIHIVYNEISRQFSMPYQTHDLVEQYLAYTYPYGIFTRLVDIKKEIMKRKIHGLIHYVQAFCFRQIEDLIIRHEVSCPVLTIEGDMPINIDARTRIRIETFVKMLQDAQ